MHSGDVSVMRPSVTFEQHLPEQNAHTDAANCILFHVMHPAVISEHQVADQIVVCHAYSCVVTMQTRIILEQPGHPGYLPVSSCTH